MDSFWRTWEVHCWAAAFKYEQYVEEHPGPYRPFSKETLSLIYRALDRDFDEKNQ